MANDDAAYWFRRFMLSLQIGNGAGFVASLAGILHAEHIDAAARLAGPPAICFGVGVIMAGTLPAILWLERHDWVAKSSFLKIACGAFPFVTSLGAMGCFFLAVGAITHELVALGVKWPLPF